MRRTISAALLAMAVAGVATVAWGQGAGPTTAPAGRGGTTSTVGGDVKREMTEVPVRRVVLFSSGVGFFQHSGRITGNAATELRFKTDQINDILKSLVVSDTSANGGVKSITYGSQNPVSRTLKSFQIDISSNPTLAGIVNQIRGTKITLSLQDDKVEGVVLGVEEKDRPVGKADEGKVVKVSYVNLITATGIRSVPLDDVKRLEIQDEALQKELDQALTALAQARDKDKKPVIVNFDGDGERPVSIAYLLETPVWKTSYRLILPDPTSRDSATLLGWAIVENQTDNDWNNVTLDLVGGRPISFIQDLYQPLYVPRPKVQPKTYASLTPQTYDEGLDVSNLERPQLLQQQARAAPGAPAASPAGGRGGRGGGGGGLGGGGGGGAAGPVGGAVARDQLQRSLSDQEVEDLKSADFAQGVRSIADATKVGEMFQYSVKGVTLPRQRSSMIPIITGAVPFDRVSIYNRNVLARNALLGVRLKNQTSDYLLAGPLAILDKVKRPDGTVAENYAGDATVDDLPPGQERLMSYAVDQELIVDAKPRDAKSRLLTGSIVKGELHLRYTDSVMRSYVLENKGDREKQVVLEDPIEPGYELKQPTKALEKTDKVYRFQLVAGPKKTYQFDVTEERGRGETIALLPMDVGALVYYSKTGDIDGGKIPEKVRTALKKAADLRQTQVDLERRLQRREADRARVLQDQGNIRENIKVLPSTSKNYTDALTDLGAKEDERKQADKDIAQLQTAIEKARADYEAYLSDLNVEG